jgi:hypothetical protein
MTWTDSYLQQNVGVSLLNGEPSEADEAGLGYFVSNLREGQSLQDIARSFYQSDEFRGQFEQFDDNSYINQLYVNVLGREADQSGIDYWVNDIQQNGRSHRGRLKRRLPGGGFYPAQTYGRLRPAQPAAYEKRLPAAMSFQVSIA